MQLGVSLEPAQWGPDDGGLLLDTARRAERLGFDYLLMSGHVLASRSGSAIDGPAGAMPRTRSPTRAASRRCTRWSAEFVPLLRVARRWMRQNPLARPGPFGHGAAVGGGCGSRKLNASGPGPWSRSNCTRPIASAWVGRWPAGTHHRAR